MAWISRITATGDTEASPHDSALVFPFRRLINRFPLELERHRDRHWKAAKKAAEELNATQPHSLATRKMLFRFTHKKMLKIVSCRLWNNKCGILSKCGGFFSFLFFLSFCWQMFKACKDVTVKNVIK
ncbi:hypothetical protein CEXT_219101 [Caerostris extrusa]|uniref:Uncharacterized protein n=1 Tax=Caerostris extrusa TaxID=172846 RepID=A0AAV4X0V9_CAEEX|nr:hypothetical protein CEXT_219101 [Caerostris extrusa]